MPLVVNYALRVLKEEFARIGIFLLHEFEDGQTRWGDQPLSDLYSGSSCMASEYRKGRYDIFTVRAIANRLEMSGHLEALEPRLNERMHENDEDKDIARPV